MSKNHGNSTFDAACGLLFVFTVVFLAALVFYLGFRAGLATTRVSCAINSVAQPHHFSEAAKHRTPNKNLSN